ncbi:MAG: hypothetical protein Q4D55_04335 [Eubacteriales bacterium]|nr:hypothetical protein [Eubacteriales bacterium]
MKERKIMKKLAACLLAMVMALGGTVPVSAAVVGKRAQKVITAGQSYHIMNTAIGANNISSYTIYITPRTSRTRFDLAAAACYKDSSGNYQPTETVMKNCNKAISVNNTAGTFVKSSSGSNVGMLACLRVRRGSVHVRVDYKTTNRGMSLSFQQQKKNHKTLRYKRVPVGKQALFTMTRGNLSGTPLIMSGVSGSVTRRTLGAVNSFENYSFGPSKLNYSVYYKGTLLSKYTKERSYDTTYSKWRYIMLRTKSRNSSWLTSTAGSLVYYYPADYVGMSVQVR